MWQVLIGVAKSATPGSCAKCGVGVSGEGLSRKELFLYCDLDPLRLLKRVLEMGISICIIRN